MRPNVSFPEKFRQESGGSSEVASLISTSSFSEPPPVKAIRKPSSTTLLATARQTAWLTSLSEYLPLKCITTKGFSPHQCESSSDNAL